MTGRQSFFALALALAGLAGVTTASAETYNYTSTVTLCTGTCASFAALDVGSTINGTIVIDTAPGGSFADPQVGDFTFDVNNPALPPSGGAFDPVNNNPLVLSSVAGIAATNGSTGTADGAGELNSGELRLEFLVAPFSSNDAFVIINLATGNGQVCLFYATAGCIPGATEAVKFEGSFTCVDCVAAEPAIELSGTGLTGNNLVFDPVQINGTSTRVLSVSNTGDAALTVTSITAASTGTTVADPGFVIAANTCGATIAADSSCQVDLDFGAMTPGDTFTGLLTIDSVELDDIVVNLSASAVAGTIDLAGDDLVQVDDETYSLEFDSFVLGALPAEKDVTISNVGDGTLSFGSITDLAAPYTLAADNCTGTLAAGSMSVCQITVIFEPTDVGVAFPDSFTVSSDDPDTPVVTVNVDGSATDAPEPRIRIQPTAADFGTLLVGDSSEPREFVISNTGSDPLEIFVLEVVGVAEADYAITSNTCGAIIPVGGRCAVEIVFTPSMADLREATIFIESNAVNNSGIEVIVLSGVGFSGPRIEILDTELVFGSTADPVDIGAVETAILTVSSTGSEGLVVTAATIDPDSAGFAVGENTCAAGAVEPESTCTIEVLFSPQDTGDATATLTVASEGNAPVDVALTGFVFEGPRGQISVPDDEPLVIGTESEPVVVGESANSQFMLMSTGTDPLTVNSIVIDDESQFTFDDDCLVAPVPSGESCAITVTFTPAQAGLQTATMTIVTNDVTTFAASKAWSSGSPRNKATTVIMLNGFGLAAAPPPPPPPAPPAPTNTPPSFALNDDGSSGGCFIATAAYGSYLDPQVMVLRQFRDNVLLTNGPGQAMVRFYYRYSPPVAEVIAGNTVLRTVTRWALTPLVYALKYPAGTLILLVGLLLLSRRRRVLRAEPAG